MLPTLDRAASRLAMQLIQTVATLELNRCGVYESCLTALNRITLTYLGLLCKRAVLPLLSRETASVLGDLMEVQEICIMTCRFFIVMLMHLQNSCGHFGVVFSD